MNCARPLLLLYNQTEPVLPQYLHKTKIAQGRSMRLLQIAGNWRLAVNFAAFIGAGVGLAVAQTGTPPTPSMDKRMEGASAAQLTPQRQQAADRLQARLPSVAIDYDLITGSPNWIWSNSRFLTGPDTEDEKGTKHALGETNNPVRPHSA
jgi:hypothetical protein